MRLHYEIKGMTCAACVSHVEKAVCKVIKPEDTANVSLLTNSVSLIVGDEENIEALQSRLAASVKSAGYELVTQKQENQKEANENRKRILNLALSVFFTLCVMYLSMGSMIGLSAPSFLRGAENAALMCLAQFALRW